MIKISDLKPGDGVWIEHHRLHPAVVLRVDTGVAVVVVGSSKGREHMEEVCVRPMSAAGRMLGLSMPTYFNSTRIAVVADNSAIVRKCPNRCPPNVFEELAALVQQAVRPPVSGQEQPASQEAGAAAHTGTGNTVK